MSEPNTFYLKPLTVQEAIVKWVEIAQQLFGQNSIQGSFQTNVINLTANLPVTHAQTINEQPAIQKIRKLLSEPLPDVICINFSITHHNSQPNTVIAYNATQDSVFATIAIQNVTDPELIIKYYKKLCDIFSFIPKSNLVLNNLPSAQQIAIKYQEGVLGELRTETAKIALFNTSQTKELSNFLTQSTVQLEERARQREAEIELKRQAAEENFRKREEALQEQYKQKFAELEKREDEHKRRVEDINAKENMVVRRQLLEKITKLISDQSEFSLSKSVTDKRQTVRNICMYSMAGALVWIIFFLSSIAYSLIIRTDPRWYQYTPLSVGAMGWDVSLCTGYLLGSFAQ